MAKPITVFGATRQHLLTTGRIKVRGVMRNPDSKKAKALNENEIEKLKEDLDVGRSAIIKVMLSVLKRQK